MRADRNVRPTLTSASSLLMLGFDPAVLFADVARRVYPESHRAVIPSMFRLAPGFLFRDHKTGVLFDGYAAVAVVDQDLYQMCIRAPNARRGYGRYARI